MRRKVLHLNELYIILRNVPSKTRKSPTVSRKQQSSFYENRLCHGSYEYIRIVSGQNDLNTEQPEKADFLFLFVQNPLKNRKKCSFEQL